jgi:hypothetical protein
MGSQRRHNDNVVRRLPKNASNEEKEAAQRNLDAARAAATLTPEQVRRRDETRPRNLTVQPKRRPGPSKKEWD